MNQDFGTPIPPIEELPGSTQEEKHLADYCHRRLGRIMLLLRILWIRNLVPV